MDPISLGLLGVASNLLANLNSTNPKNDFEALKVIDENDPIRLSLQAFPLNAELPPGTFLFLKDGAFLALGSVMETGYGATRIRAGIPISRYKKSMFPEDIHYVSNIAGTRTSEWRDSDIHWGYMVIRYQDIARVFESDR